MNFNGMSIEEVVSKVECLNDFKCLKHGVSLFRQSKDKCLSCFTGKAGENCPNVSIVDGLKICGCSVRKFLSEKLGE